MTLLKRDWFDIFDIDFVNELRIIEQINTVYEFIEICF